MATKNANPGAGGRRGSGLRGIGDWRELYQPRPRTARSTGPRPRGFMRELLPDAEQQARKYFDKLGRPSAEGWCSVRCPFHHDSNASAAFNIRTGGFVCHGCGVKHDLIGFHQHIKGLSFIEAARDLGAWR